MNDSAATLPADDATALGLLEDMLRIRRLEEKAAEFYSAGKIRGFLHLYIGEEAVAAGAMRQLQAEDSIFTTYREHGHALLRGMSAATIMTEMFGKVRGCSRGRGGSMHLFDASLRFYGGSAIVAGALPLAVGMALADQMRGRKQASACFFGEGAMAEGASHESLNLAALWNLPVLFLCENNLYAMGTALSRSQVQTAMAERARLYGISSESVDGMDVAAVHDAVGRAAEAVRSTGRPHFVELRTYRFRAHSMFDAELYREKAEIEEWKQRDPIPAYQARLEAAGRLTPDVVEAMQQRADKEMEAAVREADAAPWEPVEDLTRFIYTRNAAHERHEREHAGEHAHDVPRGDTPGAANGLAR